MSNPSLAKPDDSSSSASGAEVSADAPGRVNLIGEHTDYNGGFVLPMALPQRTHCVASARTDGLVRARTADVLEQPGVEYKLGEERAAHTWADYVQGLTWALRQNGFQIGGFDLSISSDVPIGKGLSSSASLEISVLRVVRSLFHLRLDDVQLAMTAHKAETEFVGAPVGIMDQMVCSLGDEQTALFLDAMTRDFRRVPMPRSAAIAVVDSGIEHHHASGNYRIRRRECDDAAARLGVRLLRELSVDDLPRINQLPDPLNRRARHVVTENARVLAAVSAMERDDITALGGLFLDSHASMRDDFEVSLPEIDRLVEIARGEPGVLGARLTGGGFGGAVVILGTDTGIRDAANQIATRYRQETQRPGLKLLPVD
jgi:galactokinase